MRYLASLFLIFTLAAPSLGTLGLDAQAANHSAAHLTDCGACCPLACGCVSQSSPADAPTPAPRTTSPQLDLTKHLPPETLHHRLPSFVQRHAYPASSQPLRPTATSHRVQAVLCEWLT